MCSVATARGSRERPGAVERCVVQAVYTSRTQRNLVGVYGGYTARTRPTGRSPSISHSIRSLASRLANASADATPASPEIPPHHHSFLPSVRSRRLMRIKYRRDEGDTSCLQSSPFYSRSRSRAAQREEPTAEPFLYSPDVIFRENLSKRASYSGPKVLFEF